jgi:hypothetical protein
MAFKRDERVLYRLSGCDLLVRVVRDKDQDGFYMVKSAGQPAFPASDDQIRYPEAELEIKDSNRKITAKEIAEWMKVIGGVQSQIQASTNALQKIVADVASGKRAADSELEQVEREALRDLYRTLRIHAQSIEKAMEQHGD